MPHIEIKCYPGRTEEQKKACADKIAQDVSEIMGSSLSSISVSIIEVEPDNWKKDVVDTQIAPNEDKLYKKTGYSYK